MSSDSKQGSQQGKQGEQQGASELTGLLEEARSRLDEALKQVGDSGEQKGNGQQESQDKEGQDKEGSGGQSGSKRKPPTLLEWGVRLGSVLLLLALIGYVIWQGVQPERPPSFAFDIMWAQVEQRGPEWVVPVELQNRGSASIHDLNVTAELQGEGGQLLEEVPMLFPLVGQNELARFELWFERDPREYELRFNVGSYKVR